MRRDTIINLLHKAFKVFSNENLFITKFFLFGVPPPSFSCITISIVRSQKKDFSGHPIWHMKKVNMKSLMCNRGSLNHAHTEKDPARLTRKWLNGHKTIGNPTGFSKQFDLCILFLSKSGKWVCNVSSFLSYTTTILLTQG